MSANLRRHAVTLAMFVVVAAGLVALFDVLAPADPAAASTHSATAEAAPWTFTPQAVGVTEDRDAAFLADLFGPDVDVSADQAAALTETARRVADLLADPTSVPAGAETPTRAAMIATFTTPADSATTGWTVDEANKFIDCALAAYGSQA